MPLSTDARDRGRELAQQRRAAQRTRQEFLVELSPACPYHGLPGTYVGVIDVAGTARLAFTCPQGDEFAYSPQTGEVWLISSQEWASVSLEPLGRLTHTHADPATVGAPEWSRNGPSPV